MKFFKRENKAIEIPVEPSKSPFPYLGSGFNNGALIGEYGENEVHLDLFGSQCLNHNLAVVGWSGGGKTMLLQALQQGEDKDMNRFVITTRGCEYEGFDSDVMIVKNFVVNPFHVEEELNERVRFMVEFFTRFGELRHTPLTPLKLFDQEILAQFTESFIGKNAHLSTLTLSEFKKELEEKFHTLEKKMDLQMTLFSHVYETSKENPYDFLKNHPEQYGFVHFLQQMDSYKKILDYISCLDSLGLLKHLEQSNNIWPFHRGITVIDLSEYETFEGFSKNDLFLETLLLDYLEKLAIKYNRQTAIYLDPIPEINADREFFERHLCRKLARSRVRKISYRLCGIDLSNELLEHCGHIIFMGRVRGELENMVYQDYSVSLREMKPGEGLLNCGNDLFTLFKSKISNKKLKSE